jgi:hypothetical protein
MVHMKPTDVTRDRRAPNEESVVTERIAYRPNELPVVAGISRTAVYDALRDGRLARVKIGRATFILRDELERFIRSGGKAAEAGE